MMIVSLSCHFKLYRHERSNYLLSGGECYAPNRECYAPNRECYAPEQECYAPKQECHAPGLECYAPNWECDASNRECDGKIREKGFFDPFQQAFPLKSTYSGREESTDVTDCYVAEQQKKKKEENPPAPPKEEIKIKNSHKYARAKHETEFSNPEDGVSRDGVNHGGGSITGRSES